MPKKQCKRPNKKNIDLSLISKADLLAGGVLVYTGPNLTVRNLTELRSAIRNKHGICPVLVAFPAGSTLECVPRKTMIALLSRLMLLDSK